jgi:putative copper export protein
MNSVNGACNIVCNEQIALLVVCNIKQVYVSIPHYYCLQPISTMAQTGHATYLATQNHHLLSVKHAVCGLSQAVLLLV